MSRLRILSGSKCSLWWAAGPTGRFRAKDYFDSLELGEKAKFQVLFERLASDGRIRNTEQFRKEWDEIYCFKRGQHRLTCFREGEDWLLLHGFRKKRDKDKRHKREIATAQRIRDEYTHQARERR